MAMIENTKQIVNIIKQHIEILFVSMEESPLGNAVVPTKQCRSIISISYILWLLAARGEKSGGYKARQGGISKPALLCTRLWPFFSFASS
jgi:hypothetical protein